MNSNWNRQARVDREPVPRDTPTQAVTPVRLARGGGGSEGAQGGGVSEGVGCPRLGLRFLKACQ
jgi:hypothetical protein